MKPRTYVSSAPSPGAMRVRRFTDRKLVEPLYYRARHCCSGIIVAPFGKGVDNVVSGMKERVYYVDSLGNRPPPCLRKWEELAPLVVEAASYVGPSNRVSGSEFIATRSGSKRKMYMRAREELMTKPVPLHKLAELSFFTKTESTMWNKQQVPRIVSPRSFGFNYLLGKYLRPVEHRVFDALARVVGTDVCVAKGLTQLQKGSLIAAKLRPGRVCVGLDASRFDQTIGRELLLAEHHLYKLLYKGDKLLPCLLRCQLHNRGVARCRDGVVHADIGAMRCSGDQNTSLGNCIISCLLAKLYFVEHGIEGDILNDGDDLLMFLPEEQLSVLSDLTEWYERWGLRMKVEPPARIPEEVEFCQSRPVWTEKGYLLVRNWWKAFNTDFSGGPRIKLMSDYLVHLRNVGVCGLALAAGVPMHQAMYQAAVRHGMTGKMTADVAGLYYQARIEWASGACARSAPIHWRTRDSFWMAFGVSPTQQEAIEGWFATAEFSRESMSEHQLEFNCLIEKLV